MGNPTTSDEKHVWHQISGISGFSTPKNELNLKANKSELEVLTKLVEHNGILLEYIINKLGLREEPSNNE